MRTTRLVRADDIDRMSVSGVKTNLGQDAKRCLDADRPHERKKISAASDCHLTLKTKLPWPLSLGEIQGKENQINALPLWSKIASKYGDDTVLARSSHCSSGPSD